MVRAFTAAVLLLLCATVALAQVDYQPTAPPDTFASDRDWYRNGDPIPFAGDLYYPSGPNAYFNADSMVPTGSYDGVTLYADTLIEPYSAVFVPVTDNILQPYQRLKGDELTGTTGNFQLTYPVLVRQQRDREVGQPSGRHRRPRGGWQDVPQPAPPPSGAEEQMAPNQVLVQSARRPIGNVGIWVEFQGFRWQQNGDAVPLNQAKLTSVGEYHGWTVYADPHEPYVIYLPSRENLVAPFRRIK